MGEGVEENLKAFSPRICLVLVSPVSLSIFWAFSKGLNIVLGLYIFWFFGTGGYLGASSGGWGPRPRRGSFR